MNETTPSNSHLLADVKSFIARGERRKFSSDAREYLKNLNYGFDFGELDGLELEDKPTIIAANHFKRNIVNRISIHPTRMFGNTTESLIVAGIISIGVEMITGGKQISWIIEEDLKVKIGDATMQKDFIKLYDHIPMSKAKKDKKGAAGGASTYGRILQAFKDGKSVGVFPEGDPSHRMTDEYRSFIALLTVLGQRKNVDLQVFPVSIFYEDRAFMARFSKPIQSGFNPRQNAIDVMSAIASKLPPSIRP